MTNPFFENKEAEVINAFQKNGYYIFQIEDEENLKLVKNTILSESAKILELSQAPEEKNFFDQSQNFVKPDRLNGFRMALIAALAQQKRLRPIIYSLARNHIHWIVGNELAMQRACNLSIQIPDDESSLLPIHCDTWQGNSPYEMVFWLPLVDCYKTKSMYILPRQETEEVVRNFKKYSSLSSEELFHKLEPKIVWLDIPYGQGLIFSHAMLHGNRVNKEGNARWSMNIRFKPLLSPYSSKELGESFLPITLRPATEFGFKINMPETEK